MTGTDLRVLLVQDDPEDARLLQHALQAIPNLRSQVIHVTRFADAVDAVAAHAFDVGLLDLGLPDARGIDAVRRMRDVVPDLPLVVLSGSNDEAVAIESLQEGSQDYLLKGDVDSHLLWRALRYSMERQRLQLEVRTLSLVDDLTGLCNRAGFLRLAGHHAGVASRSGVPFLVVFIDLDDMKAVNETFGHQEGNRAIAEAAAILRDSFRQSDVLARFGSDEFVVLVTDATERSATTVRYRVLDKVLVRNARPGRRYPLSLSIGVVSSDADQPRSIEELVADASRKMQEEKRVKRVTR